MIWTEESLRAMSEADLCQQVLVPLFEAMGYQDVYYHHGGALEQGKDFVMWREESPKGRVNYGVVVKAKKITGAANKGTHEVLMQIKQALGRPYIDKRTHEEQPIHQCFLVSSHEIAKEGTNSFRSLLVQERLIGQVFTIDGEELWKLVRKHLAKQTIHAQLESAMQALGSPPHPDYEYAVTLKPGEKQFILQPKHPNAEPIPVSLSPSFPATPEGQRKREEYEQNVRTGTQVELNQESIPFENLPEALQMLFPFAEGAEYTITMGPSPLQEPIPMVLTAEGDDGSSCTLPLIVFTERRGGTDSTTLSNDKQPIPLKVQLEISDVDHRIRFNYTFQFAGYSVYWLVQAIRLRETLAKGARVGFRDLRTGLTLPSFRVQPGQTKGWEEPFCRIAEEILKIQDLVRVPIRIPERDHFTDQDIHQMLVIRKILDTGTLSGVESFNVTFPVDREVARTLLAKFEQEPVPDFDFQRLHFEMLLDQPIPLGPMQAKIRGARLSAEDLEVLRLCASGRSRRKEVCLQLKGEAEVKFPKWPRQKEEDDSPVKVSESSTPAKRRRAKPAKRSKKRGKTPLRRKGASR